MQTSKIRSDDVVELLDEVTTLLQMLKNSIGEYANLLDETRDSKCSPQTIIEFEGVASDISEKLKNIRKGLVCLYL